MQPADLYPLIAPELPRRETAVDSEGYEYDVATGEVIGHTAADERWTVDSDEAAEWVLKLRAAAEAELVKIDAQRAAVAANLDAKAREVRSRLAWWDYRFRESLTQHARRSLTGKSKTARFAWGTVAFRNVPARLEVTNDEAALEFARKWAPDKIKVRESVAAKDAIAALKAVCEESGEPVAASWIEHHDAREAVTIKTGVIDHGA